MQTLTQINGFARFGAAVEDAWRESCLADLPDAVAEQLLDGARQRRVVGGESFEHGDDASPALVVDGLLRVYRKGLDGRQVTARYVAPGGLVGLAAVFAPAAPVLDQEPLRATTLLELRADSFRDAIHNEAPVAEALCRHLVQELTEAQHTLAGDLLLSVRSRVACDLLNLAEREDRELVVRMTPQNLAAAVGSVREVVSRVLRHMEQVGLVQRRAHQLVLVDSAGLHRVWAGESGF